MKKLYVEANKSYAYGFVLTEQELRRIIDLSIEQLKKESSAPSIDSKYIMKFENGVVADTDDLETVFGQENSGSSAINSLEIILKDNQEKQIKIDFSNIDSSNVNSEISIKYNIKGNNRDWVFVTSSQIEERILKIKRLNLNKTSKSSGLKYYSILLFPMGMLIALLFTIFTGTGEKVEKLNEIKNEWLSGKLKDPIEALIKIEEAKEKMDSLTPMKYVFTFSIGSIVLLFGIYFYLLKLYPVYNFCWGDYLEVFNRRESSRKTFNTVVIIGLIISVVGGIIANYLGKI